MKGNTEEVELPRFARQITHVQRLYRDDPSDITVNSADTPKLTIGVLRPFSGLLKADPRHERGRFSELSYLTLLPLVVREFTELIRDVPRHLTETTVERDQAATTPERTVSKRASAPPFVTRTVGDPMFAKRTGTEHTRQQPTTLSNRIDRVKVADRTDPNGPTARMDIQDAPILFPAPWVYRRDRIYTHETYEAGDPYPLSEPSPIPQALRRQRITRVESFLTIDPKSETIRRESPQFTVATWPARTPERERATRRRQSTSEFDARLTTRRTVSLVVSALVPRTESEPTIGFRRRTDEYPAQLLGAPSSRLRHPINERPVGPSPARTDRRISFGRTEASGPERRSIPPLLDERPGRESVRTAPTVVVSTPLRTVETTEPRQERTESVLSPSADEPPNPRAKEVPREAARSQGALTAPTSIVSTPLRTVEAVETRQERTRSLTVTPKTALTLVTEGTVKRRHGRMDGDTGSDVNEHTRVDTPSNRNVRPATSQESHRTTGPVSLTSTRRSSKEALDLVHRREQPAPDPSERVDPERVRDHGNHMKKQANENKPYNSSEKHISTLGSIADRHMEGDPTIDRLVDHLFARFERKLRIERERRGR